MKTFYALSPAEEKRLQDLKKVNCDCGAKHCSKGTRHMENCSAITLPMEGPDNQLIFSFMVREEDKYVK